MARKELAPLQRRRFSLSVRFSVLLVIAAIVPLLITLVISELQARPALIAQANTAMASDVKTRVQLIDTYFNERMLDAQTLGQVPSVQTFLAAQPGSIGYQSLAIHATYALGAGAFRDKHYTTWSMFDPQGNLRLFYPTKPALHGKTIVPQEDLQAVQAGKTFISPVYYSPATHEASVNIYSPIVDATTHTFLGFIRADLKLDYIWNIVHDDIHNGQGSYAFILNNEGVRIADSSSNNLFTSVQHLTATQQQLISQEQRYGSTEAVPVITDRALASKLNLGTPTAFQTQPTGKNEPFQVAAQATSVVPWTYFALSPVNTVTAVANNQLFFTLLIAFAILVLAALGGLILGRRVTQPILDSVDSLRNSSQALSALATRQRDASAEQMWVVDSSQVGLQSVQYYTEATQVATNQLKDISKELAQNWHAMDERRVYALLERIVAATQYIEQAAQYQHTSNQKLSTALKVATQVTEQLALGATSATDAATQLEQVVKQLRYVVGK